MSNSAGVKTKLLTQEIGFVGAGQMATALGKGFLAAGLIRPSQILVSAPSDTNLKRWQQLGARTTCENLDVIRSCDVVFLAFKPHLFPKVVGDLKDCLGWKETQVLPYVDQEQEDTRPRSKLFVSIMAGITTRTLHSSLSTFCQDPRIIKVNPNTPVAIGCGASSYSLGSGATEEDGELVRRLLSSVGLCEAIPEHMQDAFTGLVTSGPAYVYTMLEGLADGGVRMGLPRNMAVTFAAQMMMGAAKMSLESGKHTGQLKDEVTSPGGTTIRAVQVLHRAGIRGTLMDAVQTAAERAAELGQK